MQDIAYLSSNDKNVVAKVPELVQAFASAVEAEFANFNRPMASEYTPLIRASDVQRGHNLSALRSWVSAQTFLPDKELSTPASSLYNLLKQSGLECDTPLHKETAMMSRFLEDLRTEPYSSYVTQVNADKFVNLLEQANEKTSDLVMARTEEWAGRTTGIARTTREDCDVCYRRVIQSIDLAAAIEGTANYADFIKKVNAEIVQYRKSASPKVSVETSAETTTDEVVVEEGSSGSASAAEGEAF